MIALEVSSAAKPPPYGGVTSSVRSLVEALLRVDPGTRYALTYRSSRLLRALRRRCLFRPRAPNAALRLAQDPWNGLLLRGARLFHSLGLWLPRTPSVPKLVTVYDLNAVANPDWCTPRWHRHRTERLATVLARTDHVVTPSEFTRRELARLFELDAGRLHTVPLAIDRDRFGPDPRGGARMRARYGDYALAVGGQALRKNYPRLVEAVAKIPDLRLLLVGGRGDATPAIRAAAERTGLGERLRLLGRLPDAETNALVNGARVFAVPSLYEGFGLTVLEAMACGTPVVCSTAASLPEVAGDAARLVDAADPDALADAIEAVLRDEALAAELRRRGRARAEAFSWEASARRLREVYREVAGV